MFDLVLRRLWKLVVFEFRFVDNVMCGNRLVVVMFMLVLVLCYIVLVVWMLGWCCVSVDGSDIGSGLGKCSVLSDGNFGKLVLGLWFSNIDRWCCCCVVCCMSGGNVVLVCVMSVCWENVLICVMLLRLRWCFVIFNCLCCLVVNCCVVVICVFSVVICIVVVIILFVRDSCVVFSL